LPHLIVEYSANVEVEIELEALLDKLHAAAVRSGMFPIGGIRIRAVRLDHYRIADCDPANGFVHATAIVGSGRPLDERQRVCEALFATLTEHLGALFARAPLAISFNMREFHPQLNFKKNNLHEYVRERSAARTAGD
jgi:5-carboxymethyl-2-hydroxymuconate isomerase